MTGVDDGNFNEDNYNGILKFIMLNNVIKLCDQMCFFVVVLL